MIYLEAQGRLIEGKEVLERQGQRRPPPRRAITEFSRAARKRLLKLFARLEPMFKGRKTFVTLTFSGTPSFAEAKAALKRLLMRWTDAYPGASAIWRMELQERGAVHFHLIAFDLPYIAQKDLQDTWTECTGEKRSIVDIRLIRTMKGVMSYCSKYVAKFAPASSPASLDCLSNQQEPEDNRPGRWWGYWRQKELPLGVELRGRLISGDLERAWRRILQVRSGGVAGEWSASGFLFLDRALELFEDLMHRGGWYESEYENLMRFGTIPRQTCTI